MNMLSSFCPGIVEMCISHPRCDLTPPHYFPLLSAPLTYFFLCPGYEECLQSLRGMADMRVQGETGLPLWLSSIMQCIPSPLSVLPIYSLCKAGNLSQGSGPHMSAEKCCRI